MKPGLWISIFLVLGAASAAGAVAQRAQSPAARRPPETLTPQSYPAEQVAAGEGRFVARCGFCHGRDAAGGEGGPDLTRSNLVAEDTYGDRIAAMLSEADDGLHTFDLADEELRAIVAFVHDRKTAAESALGGRQFVDTADLATGDPEAGRVYFNGDGRCSECHSATGDLAGIGSRFEGLALLRRMLDPAFGNPRPAAPRATVTLPGGETVTGALRYQDEFRLTLTDADGNERSWEKDEVSVRIDDPLETHFEQLGRYTDRTMHDVYSYLETLR